MKAHKWVVGDVCACCVCCCELWSTSASCVATFSINLVVVRRSAVCGGEKHSAFTSAEYVFMWFVVLSSGEKESIV